MRERMRGEDDGRREGRTEGGRGVVWRYKEGREILGMNDRVQVQRGH